MTTIKTQWLTQLYDPSAASEPYVPTSREGVYHLVYAAMLDGVSGPAEISRYLQCGHGAVTKAQRALAAHGYAQREQRGGVEIYVPVL